MGIGTDISLETGSALMRGGLVAHALVEGIGTGLQRVAQDRRDAVQILAAEVHRGRSELARAQAESAAAWQEVARLRADLAATAHRAEIEQGGRMLAERGLARALGELFGKRR